MIATTQSKETITIIIIIIIITITIIIIITYFGNILLNNQLSFQLGLDLYSTGVYMYSDQHSWSCALLRTLLLIN